MQVTLTKLADVLLLEPDCFADARGFFFESFNQRECEAAIGRSVNFVQDNHSRSSKGVLRGLHFQVAPAAQAKLVRVTLGEVFDVVVDLRPGSVTYGQWTGHILSAENRKQLWIPEGCAHGFLVLSDSAESQYKTTAYYAPEFERTLAWDDPEVAIAWPLAEAPVLSDKDSHGLSLYSLSDNKG